MAKKVARKASKTQLGNSVGSVLGQRKKSGTDALFGNTKIDSASKEELEVLQKSLTNTIAVIPIEQIERNIDQPRQEFVQEALDELAESIKVHGIIQPITIRRFTDNQYQIISGERRWRAAKLAGLKELPAYVIVVDDQQLLEMAIIENVQREDLNPYDYVVSLGRLKKEFKLTDDEVADRIGKNRATVNSYIRVLELEPTILNSLHDGDISLGHAKSLIGVKDRVLRKDLYSEVLLHQLSVRALEKKIKEIRDAAKVEKEPKKPKKSELSTEYAAVQTTLKDFFGNGSIKISVDEEKGEGKIVVPFSSVQELNRMLDLLES